MKKRKGFTLIEILVVVAIIALLISILFPSLKRARLQARRALCSSNLHQLSMAMNSYMRDSSDRMPWASDVPSVDLALGLTPIYFADVMRPHITRSKNDLQLLHCPDDQPGGTEWTTARTNTNAAVIDVVGRSYFDTEHCSYEYRISLAGLTPQEFNNRGQNIGVGARPFWQRRSDAQGTIAPMTVWFARDYDNFHGKAGTIGSRRYVYLDGHVADYEN